jgi:purine catabolism regulator
LAELTGTHQHVMADHNLSLKEICRIAFESQVTWLTGNPQGVKTIGWVTYHPEELQTDHLLLLPAPRAAESGLRLKDLHPRPAAILLYGELPPGFTLDSDEIVIGHLLQPMDPADIQHRLLTIILNHRVMLMERGVHIHTQLSQMAAEGSGLSGLAQAMAAITGRGILVQDKRLNVRAQATSQSLMSYWEEILPYMMQIESLPELHRDRKKAGKLSAILHQNLPGGLARLIAPIVVSEVARGYLSIIGLEGELDSLDQLVAEQGALVCAVEMARSKAVRETEKRLKGDLLTALLQDDISPRDTLLWIESMGIEPSLPYVAMRFAWDRDPAPSMRRMETQINGEVARLGLKTLISPMDQEIVIFCPVDALAKGAEPAISLGTAVLAISPQETAGARLICGIGTPAQDLADWRRSFRQAGQALEMAKRLGAEQPLYFPDLSVYRLLVQIEYSPELVAFQQEILGPLLAHDGGEELINTLELYFAHNGNLSQAAEALFIHRNTLNYRMERIADILDVNLDKPETLLALQLALHITRMLGSRRTPKPGKTRT